MIQSDILSRLRVMAEQFRLPVASASDPEREVTPVAPVGRVMAEVEAQLPDGRFRVFAAGQRFEMELPPNTRPGERIELTLPTIAKGQPTLGPAPQPGSGSVEASLSEVGRFVARLADQNPERGAPASLTATEPLLPDAPIDPKIAAATLRELVALSGLFYESHQAQWVAGARDTAQLRREPQGKLPPTTAGRAETPEPKHPAAPATGQNPAEAFRPSPLRAEPALPGRSEFPGRPSDAFQPAGQPLAESRPLPVRPDATPIVQQQINTLENRHIAWQVQIWPGQSMRWQIEEFAPDDRAAPEAQQTWQTHLELELPRLGAIGATLALNGGGLTLRLSAHNDATGTLFNDKLGELRRALQAAGISVLSLARENHGRV